VRDGKQRLAAWPCPNHRVGEGGQIIVESSDEPFAPPTIRCRCSIGSACTKPQILETLDPEVVEILTAPALPPVEYRDLANAHRAELRASGLSDDAITAGGFFSASDATLAILLNRRGSVEWVRGLGDSLVIPYRDAEGRETGYVRAKPGNPRLNWGEKAVKYEAPVGKPPQPYFPAGLTTALSDPTTPLLITEGEKKAAKAQQDGFPTVGLSGVWSWAVKRETDEHGRPIGPRRLLPALEAVAWTGRTVYVVFDSDAATKDKVRKAEKALAQALTERGALVRVVRLPGFDDGSKAGLDDYLVATDPATLKELLAAADLAALPCDPELLDDPARLAASFLEGKVFRFWQGGYYEYVGTHYVEVPEYDLKARLTGHCQEVIDEQYARAKAEWQAALAEVEGRNKSRAAGQRVEALPRLRPKPKVTPQLVGSVLGHVNAMTLLPSDTPMPCRLPDGSQRGLLAVKNGLLDPVGRKLHPHTPDWFSTTALPYEYDEKADCPMFKRALARGVGDDPERVALVQQFFGLLLTRTTGPQRFLVLAGKAATGKSTVAAAAEAMLGADNVSHLGLDEMSASFGLSSLVGKAANIAADMSELDRVDEGRLKMLTSGDAVTVNRKYLPAVSMRLTARWMLATNTVPRFADKSDGLWRRMLLVPFNEVIPEGERVVGMDQPAFWAGEAPGLLNWSLDGLAALRANHWRFTEPKASQEAKHQHRLDSDPTRRFLLECVAFDPDAPPLASLTLYGAYQEWMTLRGHSRPLADQGFANTVREVFPGATKKLRRLPDRGPKMAWSGLRIVQNLLDEEGLKAAAAGLGLAVVG
jgi:P4 family phage/plasmid primase-like protien